MKFITYDDCAAPLKHMPQQLETAYERSIEKYTEIISLNPEIR